jgi:hypothetical protein
MLGIVLFATPWWVNLLILIPVALYFLSKKERIRIGRKRLLITGIFGVAFGLVEAAVVVYLRTASGLLPGRQVITLATIPGHLLKIECYREAATIIMLCGIAMLAGQSIKDKVYAFLWTFALWDISYYFWLRITIGWPASLITPDLLFLIPTPWMSQVWFPVLVSGLTAIVIWYRS